MKSSEYREIIRRIVRSALRQKAPGFNKQACEEISSLIAINVHARMYGANVDDVDSPLWRNGGAYVKPNVDAAILLKEEKK